MIKTAELTRMRAQYTSSLADRCLILGYREGAVDAYNRPLPYYPEDSEVQEIPCGFSVVKLSETLTEGEIPLFDAMIRLPWGTVVNPKDRIKVVKQKGQTLSTPLLFNAIGPAKGNIAGNIVEVKQLTI